LKKISADKNFNIHFTGINEDGTTMWFDEVALKHGLQNRLIDLSIKFPQEVIV